MSTVTERPTITVHGREWPVRVMRHATTRSYRLTFDPIAGTLRLSIPQRSSLRTALAWAAEQGEWIAQQVDKAAETIVVGPGVVFPILGEPVTVHWDPALPRRVARDGHVLRLGGPEAAVPARVGRWVRDEAHRTLHSLSHEIAARIDRTPRSITVRDTRSRWGSCTHDGALSFSWRLIMTPPHVIRATVAHEVAHMAHMDHSPAFKALASRLSDGHEHSSTRWLRTHGQALHRFRFE